MDSVPVPAPSALDSVLPSLLSSALDGHGGAYVERRARRDGRDSGRLETLQEHHRAGLLRRSPRVVETGENGDKRRRSISPISVIIPMRVSVYTRYEGVVVDAGKSAAAGGRDDGSWMTGGPGASRCGPCRGRRWQHTESKKAAAWRWGRPKGRPCWHRPVIQLVHSNCELAAA